MPKQTLSQQQIDDIEARANAATPGPWCTDSWEIYQGTEYLPGISMWIGETCRGSSTPEQDRADAEFVAAARTDVTVLVDEVRRLRAGLAAVQALCDEQEKAARLFELPEPAWVRHVRTAADHATPAPVSAAPAGDGQQQ